MGAGIAQVAAQAGDAVLLGDRSQEFIDRGLRTISRNLERSVEKGKLTNEQREAILARIEPFLGSASADVETVALTPDLASIAVAVDGARTVP